MSNSYSQINIHSIFTVKNRNSLLDINFRERLFEYISGIIKNHEQYPLIVGGYIDHVHIFFELNPDYKVSDVMRIIKSTSSKWINDNRYLKSKFEWQSGYGAFSYSRSQRENVINYIANQKEHHSKKSFKQEYLDFLNNFNVKYDAKYLFDYFDDLYKISPDENNVLTS